ncbi:hypothetical protein [Psychroflexus gondwanensis]|jgi:hypothetical protein|uniref:hypothetical protein n=1 Tax=Psychroflexus gondwanensis TaxID=251 RepID=UPI00039BD3A5|nr:hypothetical protein [Psychroflexus gondwanensis]
MCFHTPQTQKVEQLEKITLQKKPALTPMNGLGLSKGAKWVIGTGGSAAVYDYYYQKLF